MSSQRTDAAVGAGDAEPTNAELRAGGRGASGGGGKEPGKPSRVIASERKLSPFARFWRDKVLLLLAVPGVVLLLLFHYVPLLGNVIAFQDYQPFLGISEAPWVGWRTSRSSSTATPTSSTR